MLIAGLAAVTAACSIPVGSAGDLRLVPSVRKDLLGDGVAVGGNVMGLNLGFAVGARCLGLVSTVQGNGRCVGVGFEHRDDPAPLKPPAMVSEHTAASRRRGGARKRLEVGPAIEDGDVGRGVSGGASVFGVDLGLSVSGRCFGVVTGVDGDGRCLGIGLRPGAEADAPSPPTAETTTPRLGEGGEAPVRAR